MERKNVTVSADCSVLALVFVILKLTNVIDWSWWWVLAPLWAPFLLLSAIAIICTLGIVVISLFE
jgi:hypothetical protein